MGNQVLKMSAPFTRQTLIEAAMQCGDHDVLFIDEISKMADNGPAMAEVLLHLRRTACYSCQTERSFTCASSR